MSSKDIILASSVGLNGHSLSSQPLFTDAASATTEQIKHYWQDLTVAIKNIGSLLDKEDSESAKQQANEVVKALPNMQESLKYLRDPEQHKVYSDLYSALISSLEVVCSDSRFPENLEVSSFIEAHRKEKTAAPEAFIQS